MPKDTPQMIDLAVRHSSLLMESDRRGTNEHDGLVRCVCPVATEWRELRESVETPPRGAAVYSTTERRKAYHLKAARTPDTARLPAELRGDGPCSHCGTEDLIVWFTESVFWNEVCRAEPDFDEGFMCIPCFVAKAHERGFRPTSWRLLPEWPWAVTQSPSPSVESGAQGGMNA